MPEKALQDQIIVQMFAGHETTAAIMTNMLQRIKANPHVLQRMREEQQDLIKQYGLEFTGETWHCVIQHAFHKGAVNEACHIFDLKSFRCKQFVCIAGMHKTLCITECKDCWHEGLLTQIDMFRHTCARFCLVLLKELDITYYCCTSQTAQ